MGRGGGVVGARRGEAHLGVREVRTIGAHEAGGGEPLDLLAERGRPRAAVAARGRTAAREEVVHDAPSLAAKRVDVRGGDGASPTRGVTLERRRVRSGERTGVRTGTRGRRVRGRHRARGGMWWRPRRERRSETRHLARLCSSIERMKINVTLKIACETVTNDPKVKLCVLIGGEGSRWPPTKSQSEISPRTLRVGEAAPPARASHTVRARLRTQTRYEQWRP